MNSAFTLALIVGLTVADTSENAASEDLSAGETSSSPKPVFAGDTLWAERDPVRARVEIEPSVGNVSMRCRGINQRREVVIEFDRTFMAYRREADEVRDTFPAPTPTGP